jgi:hypothetical protein
MINRKSIKIGILLLSIAMHAYAYMLLGGSGGLMVNSGNIGEDNAQQLQGKSFTVDLISEAEKPVPQLQAVAPPPDERHVKEDLPQPSPTSSLPVDEKKEQSKTIVQLAKQEEPHYFNAKELTEKPRVLQDIPSELDFGNVDVPHKSITLDLLINEFGELDKVVVDDKLLSDDVKKTLQDAFLQMRFYPGMVNNVPVKSQLKILVNI